MSHTHARPVVTFYDARHPYPVRVEPATSREVHMPQPVTMAEIDALRGEALDLLDEIRARRGVDCSLLRLLLEALRDEIDEKLAQWWQQNGLVRR